MKKIIVALLAIAASLNVMAVTITAKTQITLKATTSNKTDVLYLIQASDLSEGYNSGYCSEVFEMASKEVAFYAYYNSTAYGTFGTKTLGNMAFGLKTNADTDYTLTFTQVSGAETLQMKDNVTGTLFNITEGYVYNFTANANENITTRFQLFVAPSTPEICHRYGKLQVSGSIGQNVVVKNMDDSATSIGTVAITADYQEIDLAGLAAGQYKVEWNSQTLIIDVK